MHTLITKGISVSVDVSFETDYSKPLVRSFLFSYEVTIENNNPFAVRVKSRHWRCFESLQHPEGLREMHFEIEGKGIMGGEPVIEAGGRFSYISSCKISGELGTMQGTYQIENVDTGSTFTVEIPLVELVAPAKLN